MILQLQIIQEVQYFERDIIIMRLVQCIAQVFKVTVFCYRVKIIQRV